MKKKLFYVVEKQLDYVAGFEETTGWKTITTYSIVDNDLKKQFEIECTNDENSQNEIKDYLIDNGMSENPNDEYEIIQL